MEATTNLRMLVGHCHLYNVSNWLYNVFILLTWNCFAVFTADILCISSIHSFKMTVLMLELSLLCSFEDNMDIKNMELADIQLMYGMRPWPPVIRRTFSKPEAPKWKNVCWLCMTVSGKKNALWFCLMVEVELKQHLRYVVNVREDPATSTRRKVSPEGLVDHTSIWMVLNIQQLYPYHAQKVRLEDDYSTTCILINIVVLS